MTHRTPLSIDKAGLPREADGGVPVLMRALVGELNALGIPNSVLTGTSVEDRKIGDSATTQVQHQGVPYTTTYVNLGPNKIAADRWMERQFGDRAVEFAQRPFTPDTFSDAATPYAYQHRAHLLRMRYLHAHTAEADARASALYNELVTDELARQIEVDDSSPVVIAVGPVFFDIARRLSDVMLGAKPRCIYWSDAPWIDSKDSNGGCLREAPTPSSIECYDAVLVQTAADARAMRSAFHASGNLPPPIYVRPALPNLDEFANLTGARVENADLDVWRRLPHRLMATGSHTRRNLVGQILAFGHRLSTQPELVGRAHGICQP